tara:strand:- start:1748 stop:2863 length:1116 start_codon:yes stop_codon:yes gene_type:complete
MQIALDARNILNSRNGIGRTIFCFCDELQKRGIQLDYYWPENPGAISKPSAQVSDHVSHFSGRLGRIIWSQTALPHQINAARPDMFWGPAHRLPARLDPSIPCAVTIHDLVWAKYPQTMRWSGWLADRILAPHAMARANAIIAVSQSTRQDIIERYPHYERKIHVICPGVATLAGNPNETAAEFSNRPTGDFALFVGTLEPRKNLAGLLQALAGLKSKGLLTGKLRIVGGQGWRHASLEGMIRAHNLQDRVTAMGFVSDETLDSLYRQAHFLIMPSLYEGFGLPIIEANHYGIPVLTSNISSMPEAAGNAGLLVDPLDSDDIAKKWQSLWNDERLYADLAAKARLNAARFSWQESAARMETLFEQLIADTR